MSKSFWFPHDYNASDDVKMLYLRQQLGMEGIGIFWYIIERLAQSGGVLPLSIIPVLSMQIGVPDNKIHTIITEFSLFKVDENNFQSARLSANIKHVESTKKKQSKGGKKGMQTRWGKKDDNEKSTFVL